MHDEHETHSSAPLPVRDEKPESFFKEIVKFSVVAFLIVVPIRVFIAQPFIVSGASMAPTFETGEYLIVDQLSYRLDEPARGDVVVFRYPEDPSKFFIKRIVGLPTETVEIRDGVLIIRGKNGEQIVEEPYLADENKSHEFLTEQLDADEYFVLGDNRRASSDSRVWGALPAENIVGRAFLRLLPVTHFGILPGSATEN